jgi:trigger factor
MNITQEKTGDLTSTIKVELTQEDYQSKIDKNLKELQRNATLKGFRPGKVPMGIIKKMYGTQVLADEINKIVSDSLNNYIKDNNFELLGHPLSNLEKTKQIDFENDNTFDFYFDIAVAPTFDLELSDKTEVDYYDIVVDDEKLEFYLEDVKKRNGSPQPVDTIEEEDLVKGKIVQLNEEGNILEGGIMNDTSLIPKYFKDEKVKQSFIGKKVGDKIVFNPLKASGNIQETASMLGITKEEAEKVNSDFEFTITETTRNKPAELNEELFKKVYPTEDIKSLEEFREKLREDVNKHYQVESENYFVHMTLEELQNKITIEFPEDFLKKWLLESDEKLTKEQIEKDFDGYTKSLKQQLIINKLARDYDIKVEEKDIRAHIKQSFAKHYGIDSTNEEMLKQLDGLADSIMQNKEEVNKVYDELFDNQMRDLFKEKIKLNKKTVTYDEFTKIVQEHHKQHHNHEH